MGYLAGREGLRLGGVVYTNNIRGNEEEFLRRYQFKLIPVGVLRI